MNIETVKTDAFTMDYLRFGRGKDSLVILPGLSVQSVMGLGDLIAEAYQVLTEDFTIYLFDRRKDLPAQYPIREMARDTAEALRALGLSSVALFGASQGGMIAMALAAEHPELVSRLVPGSSAARVDGEHCRLFEDWIDLAKRRIRWNYKTAVPSYYPRANTMSLLLPLCLLQTRISLTSLQAHGA